MVECKTGRFMKGQKPWNEIEIPVDMLRHLYIEKDLSTVVIGLIFGVATATICKKLKKYGVEMKSPQFSHRNQRNPLKVHMDKDILIDLYCDNRFPLKRIASILGVSITTICERMDEYGIKRRDAKESHPKYPATILREQMPKKKQVAWNKGMKGPYAGENSPHWKGGKPKCIDCGKQLSTYSAKRCQLHANRIMMTKDKIKKCLRRRTPSSLEQRFQSIIDKHKLPYKFVGNGSFLIERYNPDFINVNGQKIAIEVYARYYKLRHNLTIKEWKRKRREIFREYGWKIIFFDETQVNEINVLKHFGGKEL